MSSGEGDFRREPMSVALRDVETASDLVVRLEDMVARRRGAKVSEVRPSVARLVGVSVGTIENIRKRRRKGIQAWLLDALRRVLIDKLQSEVRALEHEVQLHLQAGSDHRSNALAQAETQVLKARAALMEAVRSD